MGVLAKHSLGQGPLALGVALFLLLAAIPVATVSSPPALAVEPDEILDDPALEARARKISAGLRCLVCQNQSIDDSNAPLAKDLRILVRERLKAGDSDDQVIAFIVDRYGEFVLLRPPFGLHTLLLWLGPLLLLVLAGWFIYRSARRRAAMAREASAAGAPPLSEEEKRRLARLLDDAGA